MNEVLFFGAQNSEEWILALKTQRQMLAKTRDSRAGKDLNGDASDQLH